MSKYTYIVLILFSLIMVYLCLPAHAQLKPMQKEQMDTVTGQSGVSIEFDKATFYDEFDEIAIYEGYEGDLPDGNLDNIGYDSVKLQNVVFSDGGDWGYTIDTKHPLRLDILRYDDTSGLALHADSLSDPNTDPETDGPDAGGWFTTYDVDKYREPGLETNLNMRVGKLVFAGETLGDLGALEVGKVNIPYMDFWIAPNDEGIKFKGDLSLEIGHKYVQEYIGPEQGFNYRAGGGDNGPGIVYAYNDNDYVALDNVSINLDAYKSDRIATLNIVKTDEGWFSDDMMRVKMKIPEGTTGDIKMGKVYNSHINKDMGPLNFNGVRVHEMEVRFTP